STLDRPAGAFQSGTFAGNPMSMVAGHATLSALTAETIASMNRLGDDVRTELEQFCRKRDYAASVTGFGSLLNFQFAPGPVRSTRDTWRADRTKQAAFVAAMMDDGYFLTGRAGAAL